jgi:hypothetical protein
VEFVSKEDALKEWKADIPDAEAIFAGSPKTPFETPTASF